MDFSRTDEQVAIADLAGQILAKHATPERLRTFEDDPAWTGTDADLWAALAEANLLGLNVPSDHGGSGLGLVEASELLEQAGRAVAPVPLLATVAYAVPVLAHFGTPEQQAAWLPGVVAGDVVLTAALVEALGDPLHPTTVADPDGDGWLLSGTKVCVPAGLVADRVLVAASTPTGEVGLFLVDPAQDGVTVSRQDTVSRVPEAMIELDGARVGADALVGPLDGDATTLVFALQHAMVGIGAFMTGVAEAALKLTADYTSTREQFGRPIATFQAVGQRAANAFIDTQAIRLTTLHAAWLLDAGRDAAKEVAVAKYFASEAGQRVTRAAQHLHGGMGVDRDYPVHRYYLWSKQLELTLGGASRQLTSLGRILAEEPVEL
jgi:alkylation response protein AidB-like acyl-CoA dehydrogenase